MKTERLDYHDATRRTFDACVVARRDTARGPAVALDRTAFYPTSGGQPHDTGTLNGTGVRDVWEDDDGIVWHLLEAPIDTEAVSGVIDWERRFDHMQQHTGQHLLSAALIEVLDAPTMSFHLGSESSTIDVDVPRLGWEAAARVEAEVNRVVWEDRPVTVHFVEPANLGDVPLRKPPQVEGTVRVIWAEGCDASACGGTHVRHTGEVGLIKITGLARYKGGVRVTFLCGWRALRDYHRVLRLAQTTSTDLSVAEDELPEAVARLQDEVKAAHRATRDARTGLAEVEAELLWSAATEEAGVRPIVAHWPGRDFAEARAIASQLRERPRTLLLLAVTEPEKGVRLVCARSDDLDGVDAAAVLRAALEPLGGRGGGSPAMAQGGAPARSEDEVWEALRGAVREGREA